MAYPKGDSTCHFRLTRLRLSVYTDSYEHRRTQPEGFVGRPGNWPTRLSGASSLSGEGRSPARRGGAGQRLVVATDRRCLGHHSTVCARQIQQGVVMTTDSVVSEV